MCKTKYILTVSTAIKRVSSSQVRLITSIWSVIISKCERLYKRKKLWNFVKLVKANEQLKHQHKHLILTVRHGGGGVMIGACFAST